MISWVPVGYREMSPKYFSLFRKYALQDVGMIVDVKRGEALFVRENARSYILPCYHLTTLNKRNGVKKVHTVLFGDKINVQVFETTNIYIKTLDKIVSFLHTLSIDGKQFFERNKK